MGERSETSRDWNKVSGVNRSKREHLHVKEEAEALIKIALNCLCTIFVDSLSQTIRYGRGGCLQPICPKMRRKAPREQKNH
ncbi:hypothetical protein TNCV_645201 [Trichonephila clavipes]|nr:hypothetical protein TNCV_645201 [Trichonephila clavipes]